MYFQRQTIPLGDVLIPYQQAVHEVEPSLDFLDSLTASCILMFNQLNMKLQLKDDETGEKSELMLEQICEIFVQRFYDRDIEFETEMLFKMKLASKFKANALHYSKLFDIMLQDFELSKIDYERIYDKTSDRTNDLDLTGETDTTMSNDSTGHSDSNTISHSDTTNKNTQNNFNRKLDDQVPAERLMITANDGVGLIQTASSIAENKELNNTNGEGTTDTTASDEQNTKNSAEGVNNTDYTEVRNEVGKIIDHFNERKVGYDNNASLGKQLYEYKQNLEPVFEQIMSDLKCCFSKIYI